MTLADMQIGAAIFYAKRGMPIASSDCSKHITVVISAYLPGRAAQAISILYL